VLFVAVARSSDGVAIRYVLPVLRMTSYHGTNGRTDGRARRCVVDVAADRFVGCRLLPGTVVVHVSLCGSELLTGGQVYYL